MRSYYDEIKVLWRWVRIMAVVNTLLALTVVLTSVVLVVKCEALAYRTGVLSRHAESTDDALGRLLETQTNLYDKVYGE